MRKAQHGRVIDDMRPGVIMAAAIARKNDRHPSGIIGQANEQPCLRRIWEAQECFLNAVQRIIGPHAFPGHHPSKAHPVLMHPDRTQPWKLSGRRG